MVLGEIQLGLHLPSGIIHNAAGDQNAAMERISKQFYLAWSSGDRAVSETSAHPLFVGGHGYSPSGVFRERALC
jgi:hypothetical protein